MNVSIYMKGYYEDFYGFGRRKNKANSKPISIGTRAFNLWRKRLPRPFGPPKKIDGFCSGRIWIATVAAFLRNDISWLFSFLCILRIRSGFRNDTRISVPLCLCAFVAMSLFEKTKPICRPLAGNPKHEALNPKQARSFGQEWK